MTQEKGTLLEIIARQTAETLEIVRDLPTKEFLYENFATKHELEDLRFDVMSRIDKLVKEDLKNFFDFVDLHARVKALENRMNSGER